MSRNALVPGSAKEEQFIRLVDTYSHLLTGLCVVLLKDWHLAQDVVQETFLRAWRYGKLIPGQEKPWLVRVAVNLCRDQQRRGWMRRIDRTVTPEELTIPVPFPDNDVIREVYKLPQKEREVIVMHFWGNLSAAEIADALHIGRASVYRRMESAKKKLRLELTEKGESAHD